MNAARTPCIVGTVALALATLALANVGSLSAALVFLSIASWGGHMLGSAAWVLVTAAAPQEAIGSPGGMHNCVGSTAGAVASIATGFIVQATGSFYLALMIGLGIAVGVALVYLLVRKTPIAPRALDGIPSALAMPI